MPDLESGSEFAGHRIEGVAGRGGMGVVYRATHLALDHVVALKVISPELAGDQRFRERFRSESRIAVSLRHPNVVAVHHAGEEDGLMFVTMDLIEGTDLRGLLNEVGKLSPEQASEIVSQVASALDVAHERGLVHRDIKPGNILIERRAGAEHVYLTDFGLTKRIEATSGITATGAFVGTLDYVAPEQIQGKRVDARTDVYALGCVLYEMIGGRAPFASHEENVAKMYAHLQQAPVRLIELAPGTPEELDGAVRRAMEKYPEDRFPSAGDLSRAVAAAVEGRAVGEAERSVATGLAAPTEPDAAPTPVDSDAPAEAIAATTEAREPPSPPEPVGADSTVAVPPPEPPTRSVEIPAEPPSGLGGPPVEPAEQPSEPPERAPARRARSEGPRRGRALLGLGALAVAAVVAVVLLMSGGGGDEPSGKSGGKHAGGGGGKPEPAQVVDQAIPVGGFPVSLAVDDSGVWVTSRTGNIVSRLDPGAQSPDAVSQVDVAAPEGIAAGEGAIWVIATDAGQVWRVDPASGDVTAQIAVGSLPRGVAVGEGAVWASVEAENSVAKIDPSSNALDTKISVGDGPHQVAVGDGAVWVSNRLGNSVSRIDPGSGEVTATTAVGANPKGLAVTDEAAWVANTDDGTVSRLDRGSGEVDGDPIDVGGEPRGAVAGFGSVWVANGDGYVSQIDPAQAKVVEKLMLPASPEGITAGAGSVWVANGAGNSVTRIDPGE